jgi:excisionase family DNA binding protein
MRNTCATTNKTLLHFVALQQCATCATDMILAVKAEKAKTSVQQCLQQVQLVVFLLQLTLSSSIIMPKFSISEAAKRAKVERTTLYRKIDKGEISAEIDAHGTKVIDASELLRVYPEATVIDTPATSAQQMHTVETQQNATADATMAVLLREAEMREEKIEDMKRRIEALEADKTDLRAERDRLLKVIEEQSASVKLLTEGDRKKAKPGRRFFIFGRRS